MDIRINLPASLHLDSQHLSIRNASQVSRNQLLSFVTLVLCFVFACYVVMLICRLPTKNRGQEIKHWGWWSLLEWFSLLFGAIRGTVVVLKKFVFTIFIFFVYMMRYGSEF
jgi:hypothetical protein